MQKYGDAFSKSSSILCKHNRSVKQRVYGKASTSSKDSLCTWMVLFSYACEPVNAKYPVYRLVSFLCSCFMCVSNGGSVDKIGLHKLLFDYATL